MEDIYLVYVRGKGFMPRAIQFFMRLYALRFNRVWRKPVNHADIVYSGLAWGSIAHGFLPRTVDIYKGVTIYPFRLETNKTQKEIIDILERYKYRPYDFKNFIDFIVKLFTGKWTGHTRQYAEAKLFCIEAVHMIMDELGISPSLKDAWDNDPEESRQWAIDNLDPVTRKEIMGI